MYDDLTVSKKHAYRRICVPDFKSEKKSSTFCRIKWTQSIHDRMPLILEASQIQDWLFSSDKSQQLLRHRPKEMRAFQEIEQLRMGELFR